MINDRQIRQRLEALLSRPFTDYQWSLIVAQGYEDAIASGARSAEEVAEELRGLMAAAVSRAAGAEVQGPASERALTWDEMERLVLGRALATDGTDAAAGQASPRLGARATRLAADRERSRRRWWIAVGSSLGVLAVALVAMLVFGGGSQCGLGIAQSASTTSTSEVLDADTDAWALPDTTTSTTLAPPATVPAPELPDYTAALSGSEAVPAVASEASGTLELTLSDDGQTMGYVFNLENIDELTLARLRIGMPGESGDEIFTVYPGPTKSGVFTGVAAEGTFSAEDFVGAFDGKTMADFIALIEDNSVYLVVGTTQHRGGEIRGQLH